MKIPLCVAILCVILVLCEGGCVQSKPKAKVENGKLVPPDGCIDIYDGNKHTFGSKWNTANCMKCECSESGMECCRRSKCDPT